MGFRPKSSEQKKKEEVSKINLQYKLNITFYRQWQEVIDLVRANIVLLYDLLVTPVTVESGMKTDRVLESCRFGSESKLNTSQLHDFGQLI